MASEATIVLLSTVGIRIFSLCLPGVTRSDSLNRIFRTEATDSPDLLPLASRLSCSFPRLQVC